MVVKSTCFFIDDDADNLSVFTKALEHVTPDTICFVATNPDDAIDLMRSERLVPSCIFVKEDVHYMNARYFLLSAKSDDLLKHVPVIVHGTDLSDGDIDALKKLGALAIYTKSLSFLGVSNMLSLYFRPKALGIGQN
jgi:CheY-like chemotaxis protein